MKTIDQLLNQKPVFLGLFEGGVLSIANEFGTTIDDINEYHVLYAWYDYQSYEGDAYLLLIKNNKIYEVTAGHCSCYGLEGQFEPEEVPLKVLYHRLENDSYGYIHLIEVL